MALSAPEPLAAHHLTDSFTSGEISLDDWLKRRARTNEASGASRTYVTCQENQVVGYYAIASGAVSTSAVPGRFRRNMPEPIPVVLLGRLAVDRAWQGKGVGGGLFKDACRRISRAAEAIGIRGILVQAISDEARSFYLRMGFLECPLQPQTLVITLEDLREEMPKR